MPLDQVKLFHLPHEGPTRAHIESRDAFEALHNSGRISELRTFSFLVEAEKLGNTEACREILRQVRAFQPDIVFWQNVDWFEIDDEFIAELRAAAPQAVLAYWEGDPYGGIRKRYQKSLRVVMRGFDAIFQVAMGWQKRMSEKAGAKHIYWGRHCFSSVRFPPCAVDLDTPRQFDAVMIANLQRRIPLLWGEPGADQRYDVARRLTKALGKRFGLYGTRWKLPSAAGFLHYNQIHQAIRSAWLSVGWDHHPGLAWYFSDRLPIAMAAGLPHVTSYHPGYEDFFTDCPGLVIVKTPREAVEATIDLLSLDRVKLLELGATCREFAYRHFEARQVFGEMFDTCLEHSRGKMQGQC